MKTTIKVIMLTGLFSFVLAGCFVKTQDDLTDAGVDAGSQVNGDDGHSDMQVGDMQDSDLPDNDGDGQTNEEDSDGSSSNSSWPPYLASSFWNTTIPEDPPVRPDSDDLLRRVAENSGQGVLTSDVTQNSYPIYLIDTDTPRSSVEFDRYFSTFGDFDIDPDGVRSGAGHNPTIPHVPIVPGALSGGGSDAQVIFWDPVSGDEWALWQFEVDPYRAVNGYKYNTLLGTGRTVKSGRGAGVSKLGGLVSAQEVLEYGQVNHAVALGYGYPSAQWVFPATRSDGIGEIGLDMPEGARIQLDPTLTEDDFIALGLGPEARIIARALQRYGLMVIDNSGRAKAFLECDRTGAWEDPDKMEYLLAPLTRDSSGNPDWTIRFRVIDWDLWTGGPTGILGP